jgi:hypothetical protein
MYFVQVGQDLAHRDVIIDDVVASFFPRVAWITFPILLLLLLIDIVIFRRALDRCARPRRPPPRSARSAPTCACRGGGAVGDRAAGACRQPGARSPRGGLPRPSATSLPTWRTSCARRSAIVRARVDSLGARQLRD